MKIALVSEHASPLAVTGGVDSGGQNIYVANVARELNEMGHEAMSSRGAIKPCCLWSRRRTASA